MTTFKLLTAPLNPSLKMHAGEEMEFVEAELQDSGGNTKILKL